MKKRLLVVSLTTIGMTQLGLAAPTNQSNQVSVNQQQTAPVVKASPIEKQASITSSPTTKTSVQNASSAQPAVTQNTTAVPAEEVAVPETPTAPAVFQQQRLTAFSQATDVPPGKYGFPPYFAVSGLLNLDSSYWTHPYFTRVPSYKSNASYFDVATANVNLDSHIGSWVSGHVGLLYTNGSSPNVINAYPAREVNRRVNINNVQDAYATISNFDRTPFFIRGGLQFLPFGQYDRFPITQSFTQILSQTDLPSVQTGFVLQNGLFASLFGANGEHKINKSSTSGLNNYGASLGYQNYNHPTGYDIGLSYMSNMANVDSIRAVVEGNHGYTSQVGAWGAFGDIYAGPFGLAAHYVAAAKRFSQNDFAYTSHTGSLRGAAPTAADLTGSYRFMSFKHHSQIKIGYQWTEQAHNTALNIDPLSPTIMPKARWIVGYDVNLIKHVMLGLQYNRDGDYPRNHGGTGLIDNVYLARLSLMF